MGDFITGIFRTAGRLLTTLGATMVVYLLGGIFFEDSQMLGLLAFGVAAPGLIYAINGIFFDVFNWSILDNGFFRFIKKAVFYILWIGVALVQVVMGGTELEAIVGIGDGLLSTILFSSVIGVFYSIEGSVFDDFEGTWALPVKMGVMTLIAGVVVGIVGGVIPFLGEILPMVLPILANGGLLAFMIIKKVTPYSTSAEARAAVLGLSSGGDSGYSGGGYSSYDDDDDYDTPQDNRKEGGWGQLGDAMWAVAKRYDGNSYTLAYGDMRIAVFQTTTGWNTLLYEVRVFIRPGYTCTDEYCFNQLRNDAERQIQEVQEEILYAGQEALRDAQREYKAYDKNYKIEVRIVETKFER